MITVDAYNGHSALEFTKCIRVDSCKLAKLARAGASINLSREFCYANNCVDRRGYDR